MTMRLVTFRSIALTILVAGCLSVEPATTGLPFDFTIQGLASGWILGVADLPVTRTTEVNALGGEYPLPATFASSDALYQAGTNVSGDLFLFQEKYIGSIRPNTQYKVSLQLEFVTNLQSGCTTGPGPLVVLK